MATVNEPSHGIPVAPRRNLWWLMAIAATVITFTMVTAVGDIVGGREGETASVVQPAAQAGGLTRSQAATADRLQALADYYTNPEVNRPEPARVFARRTAELSTVTAEIFSPELARALIQNPARVDTFSPELARALVQGVADRAQLASVARWTGLVDFYQRADKPLEIWDKAGFTTLQPYGETGATPEPTSGTGGQPRGDRPHGMQ